MARTGFLDLLNERVILFDGGMGTMLYQKGVFINRCFDELNLSDPGLVESVHRAYVEAGADVIETNTFGANAIKLEQHGYKDNLQEINYKGAKIAREAAGDRLVAGSIGPLGIRIEPWGPTSVDEARDLFREQAQALLEGGVDLFVLETFSDINEIWQAIRAVRELDRDMPLVANMTLGEDGESLYGTAPEVFAQRLDGWGADVTGVNCSVGPAIMLDAVDRMARAVKKPIAAIPNAGLPRKVDGRNMYLASPEYMASYVKRFVKAGARVVGGCCGTTPSHVRAIHQAIHGSPPPARVTVSDVPFAAPTPVTMETIPTALKSRLSADLAGGRFVTMAEVTPPRGLDLHPTLEGVERLTKSGFDSVFVSEPPRASARMSCNALAQLIERHTGVETVVHYSCRDRRLFDMQSDLIGAWALGQRNIILETGVAPTLAVEPTTSKEADVDSIGLTQLAHRLNSGFDLGQSALGQPTGLHIGVVANPTAVDLDDEVRRFEWKVDAGAEFCVTRPVFDPERLLRFLERIQSCRIPVLVGIRPLISLERAEYLSNEVPGSFVPEAILDRMRAASERSPDDALDAGVAVAREILAAVREHVQGAVIATPFEHFESAVRVIAPE